MRTTVLSLLSISLAAGTAHAGELDLALGLQATSTEWAEDHGGGGTFDLTWWFRDWIGVSYLGKEQLAKVDERLMSYLSVSGVVSREIRGVRLQGSLGLVHQHEQPVATMEGQMIASLLGVGDGIRHRAGGRAGVSVVVPFREHAHGDWYVALDLDTTLFTEAERGPRWMIGGGVSLGVTYDFSKKPAPAPARVVTK